MPHDESEVLRYVVNGGDGKEIPELDGDIVVYDGYVYFVHVMNGIVKCICKEEDRMKE